MDLRKTSSMDDLIGYGFEEDDDDDDEFELDKDQIRICSSQDNLSITGSDLRYRRKINKMRSKPMLERLEEAAPYNIFFNVLDDVLETYEQSNSIGFADLLCPSLGELKCSLHICFVPGLEFLINQYRQRKLITKPMTIVHGWYQIPNDVPAYPNIKLKFIRVDSPMGCHDTKVSIFVYEDESLRVVVATVNPLSSDWYCLNQGIWISPLCPKLPDTRHDVQGDSPTGFKASLLKYLKEYQEDCLQPYIDFVRRADFSAVKVFFVYSFPGRYQNPNKSGSLYHQVSNILSRFCNIFEDNPSSWEILAQTPAIGFLGQTYLSSHIQNCLGRHTGSPRQCDPKVEMRVVYPTVDNVFDAELAGVQGLLYDKKLGHQQRWLRNHMCQWKVKSFNRGRVMPHTRIYCRISKCSTKLAYFFLTSANLTRSGWGRQYADGTVVTRNYEAGVIFIPKFFNEKFFKVKHEGNGDEKLFPFLLDLPVTPYTRNDVCWFTAGFLRPEANANPEEKKDEE